MSDFNDMAFPLETADDRSWGLSQREYAAIHIAAGFAACPTVTTSADRIAIAVCDLVDALEKELTLRQKRDTEE